MRRCRLVISLLGMLVCAGMPVRAQMDTEFWFAAPHLAVNHTPEYIRMVVVTYDESARISIEQPAANRVLVREQTVRANSTWSFSLKDVTDYRNTVETNADGSAHNNGLLITSSSKVSVYYVATAQNSEIYTLKGHYALGTDFVVPQQWRYKCHQNPGDAPAYASIEVVAPQDNTHVTFTTLVPTNLGDAGTYTVTLMEGQSYAIRARDGNTPGNMHLGGTLVHSDQPVAVNTTDDSATNFERNDWGDKDLVGEQLVPNTYVGSSYIVAANNSYADQEGNALYEYLYLYAIESGATKVYTTASDGTDSLVCTIQPGLPYEIRLKRLSAMMLYTLDNTPFIVFQLTANEAGCELGGTVLPSLNCSGSHEVSYTPVLNAVGIQITLLTRTDYVGSFTVNGDPSTITSSMFIPVPGHPEWSYLSDVSLDLAQGERSLRIRNSAGVFHMGVLDAGNGACSYGYFSNYGAIALSFHSTQDYYFIGEDVHFSLSAASMLENIWWEGPRGTFGVGDPSPVITQATVQDAGRYIVHATHKEGCDVLPDTMYLSILDAFRSSQVEVCIGDTVTLHASGKAPYTWFCGMDYMANQTTADYVLEDARQSAVYSIEQLVTGQDMAEWEDTLDISLTTADSAILWQRDYHHMIVGANYTWEIDACPLAKYNTAIKLQLQVNDSIGAIFSLPATALQSKMISMNWTATQPNATLRLIARSPKDGRTVRVNRMTLVALFPMVEEINLLVNDCSTPPPPDPPCTDPFISSDRITVCDTLLPYNWHGRSCNEPVTWIDTIHTKDGRCDSIITSYVFDTIHCEAVIPPEQPCLDIITQRWNDVLGVKNDTYNGGYLFVSYQWYRNNIALPGETRSYLYVPDQLKTTDTYHAEMIRDDGTKWWTCPYIPVHIEYEGEGVVPVEKVIRDGRLYIIRGNNTYNAVGQRTE